ncbi:hypothetical protein [Phenylobacterium sp.]|jgi:hypothetical protein|uniref:hypothetical protein n=1 Tax=Phenylobacterium sp. TaxID=1871053 RepID=UPI003784A34C
MDSRLLGLAALAAAAGVAGVAHAAGAFAPAPVPKTEVGFIRTADRLWAGSMSTLEACVRSRARPRLVALFLPRQPHALRERRGELIGEFLTPAPVAPAVFDRARSCATLAGAAATTPAMLAGGAPGLAKFQAAFSTCMAEHQASQYVGSMTLWIDNQCVW